MSDPGAPSCSVGSGGSGGFVGLVWAAAENGVIGRDGVMPWSLPEDLAHFKAVTQGSAVVMGRKTWDSLPPRFRPLPGRRNIVITRQPVWQANGVETAHSVTKALELARGGPSGHIWVIGGAEVFRAVIDEADRLEVTEVSAHFAGDTLAPTIGERWSIVASDPETGWHTSRTGIAYRFLRYEPR